MLIDRDEIDRVIVIAPRAEVVNQWADDFKQVTGRFMGKVTARDGDIQELGMDACATWAAVQGLLPEMQAVCRKDRTLVICDEHHHAAVEAAWGSSADSAFARASFVLILTGTPIRSDGAESVWLAYDDAGALDQPEAGTYTLTYGEAVDVGYCRPVTFHRHEGHFTVDLEDGDSVRVSSQETTELPPALRRIPGLQKTLEFYRLACTPLFESDGRTPAIDGYQASMLEHASAKLTELRNRMPNAGGLVIAPSIEMADYFAQVIETIEGERPVIVHSDMPNADQRIRAFRNGDKRWIVSVAMVSEGVDIKRLRVLAYLPKAQTELAFRQAVGRVVRTLGPDDDTRAYVVMPSFHVFEEYAKRVENEMNPAHRTDPGPPRSKVCPVCRDEVALTSATCPSCGHEFPPVEPRLKSCASCESLNPVGAAICQVCGSAFAPDFALTLDDALRQGAIVRGIELDEAEVLAGETIAPRVRQRMLSSGDETLVKIVRSLPEESWARLREIFTEAEAD
jgi:superfamily II DNA or RNA helicase